MKREISVIINTASVTILFKHDSFSVSVCLSVCLSLSLCPCLSHLRISIYPCIYVWFVGWVLYRYLLPNSVYIYIFVELISNVQLWTSSLGRAKAERPARTYIQQLCVDKGCSSEYLPEGMDDRKGWRERVKDIHADGAT